MPSRRRPSGRRWPCSRRGSTIRRISSMRFWRSRWASSWSRARTGSSRTKGSTCARPTARSACACSTGPSTTISSIRWRSGPWPLRGERLYALPGDSPLGLRLPPAQVPALAPEEVEHLPGVDPFAPQAPLAKRSRLAAAARQVRGASPREVVKTALTVELREGHVCAFLPPVPPIEAFAQLVAAIEDTAGAMACRW